MASPLPGRNWNGPPPCRAEERKRSPPELAVISATLFCLFLRYGLNDLVQQIRLAFIPDEMRVAITAVIIHLERAVVVGIFHEKRDRLVARERRMQGSAHHVFGVLAPIHSNQFHSRSHSG